MGWKRKLLKEYFPDNAFFLDFVGGRVTPWERDKDIEYIKVIKQSTDGKGSLKWEKILANPISDKGLIT